MAGFSSGRSPRCFIIMVAALTCIISDSPSFSQQDGSQQNSPQKEKKVHLPPSSTISQSMTIGGKKQTYQVTAGSIIVRDEAQEPQLEVGVVAYTIDDKQPQKRPVTFVFNGGPGASSAYLQFGALGPKRLSFGNNGDVPSASPILIDNPSTWLDFTDLVFIDPVGTGYSRFVNDHPDIRKTVWSVEGDINVLGEVIRTYLTLTNRMTSPKYLVGESYGGFRVPKLAYWLQTTVGIGVSGIIMISPVLDYVTQIDDGSSPLYYATRLPSLLALARENKGEPFDRKALAPAEEYARSEYVIDFLRGPRDQIAVDRMTDKVTQLSALDKDFVKRRAGRLDLEDLVRELGRNSESIASPYDATVLGLNSNPTQVYSKIEEPISSSSMAPLTSATVDFLNNTVGWRVEAPYTLLNYNISSNWHWGPHNWKLPEAISDLRNALALDPKLGALILHGATDLVTPYFDSQLALDRLSALGAHDPRAGRVSLEVLKGGHLFYSRDESRAALKRAASKLYQRE